jgi:hypothetical protein
MEDLFRYYPGFTGTGTSEDELDPGVGDGFVLGGREGHGYFLIGGGWGKRWWEEID